MTEKEKAELMAEIMNVVDKHISKSEEDGNQAIESENVDIADRIALARSRYSSQTVFSKRKSEMDAWKEEYKRMRVEGKKILEEVKSNPIDTSGLMSSFDLGGEYKNVK